MKLLGSLVVAFGWLAILLGAGIAWVDSWLAGLILIAIGGVLWFVGRLIQP